jgi:hypothetical protein
LASLISLLSCVHLAFVLVAEQLKLCESVSRKGR